jgi:hypothetical protein
MKYMTKTALAVAALVLGAQAQAQITNLPTATGGSDLVLFVVDTASGQYFAQDLGIQISSLLNPSSVTSVETSNGSFTTPTSLGGVDSTLATFLSNNASTLSSIEWTILASTSNPNTYTKGAQEALFTSVQTTLGYPTNSKVFTEANINTFGTNATQFFQNVNTNYAGSNTNSSYGWGVGPSGDPAVNAPESWVSATFANGAALGAAQTMYLWITNGNTAGGRSNPYVGNAVINIADNTSGTITIGTTTVPLPAAVWLLGSGLLGLLGVGRRAISA